MRGQQRATITGMQAAKIQLPMDDGAEYDISINSFLKGEWKLSKKVADVQKFGQDDFKGYMPHKNDTLNFMCIKGEVSRRLIELEIQHEPSYKGLVLQTKPYNSVFTSKQYAKGKLVLVPSTSKIERKACPGSVALRSIRDIGLHLRHHTQPSAISATPATQSDAKCHVKCASFVDVVRYHCCLSS